MNLPPIATTSIGSFPRPRWLADTTRNQLTFLVDGADRKQAMDEATVIVLRDQENLGLDIATDGEMRRSDFIFHIAGEWDGIDTKELGHATQHRNRKFDRLAPRIIGKVTRRGPAAVEDVVFAKGNTRLPIKIATPGPMTVIDSSANVFYKDEGELAMDIAAALNAELLDMQAAGADVLQIDEPAMTRYHGKVRDYGAKALDRCLEGVKVPTIVHLCYGYPGGTC